MENKFEKGQIVYSVNINNFLIVQVNKLVVDSYFFNSRPEYNKFIYSCTGIDSKTIRDYEIPETEEEIRAKDDPFYRIRDSRNPGRTSSCSTGEENLFTEDQIEEKVKEAVDNRRAQIKRLKEAAEKFRCPLTGGKIIEKGPDLHVYDGPSYYRVEGEKIVWKTYPRDWTYGVYHTEYKGKHYSFIYEGDGKWREVILIKGEAGKGMYVDKIPYENKDADVLKKVEDFLEEERIRAEKRKEEMKKAPSFPFPITAKRIHSKPLNLENIEVKPLSPPLGNLMYFDYGKGKAEVSFGDVMTEIDIERIQRWDYEIISEDEGFYKCRFGETEFTVSKEEYEKIKSA